MRVCIKTIDGAVPPRYETPGSAGLDLSSTGDYTINPGEMSLITTGILIELPLGYEGQVRPRSGTVLKRGLMVANSPGTIDSDYRGEICVILYNVSKQQQVVKKGERIAQLVVAKYESVEWEEVYHMTQTKRGGGGFGSTGDDVAGPAPSFINRDDKK